jgi:hypothetical protein
MMAPLKSPHPWGTKRPSLEQNFYEAMDRPENDVVDIKNNPVKEVTEKGIVTADGVEREFDLIALATGFDAVTGGMKNMGLLDINGVDLRERWSDGTYSHIGMACSDFPNMFFRKLKCFCLLSKGVWLTLTYSLWCTRSYRFQQRPQLCRMPGRLDHRCARQASQGEDHFPQRHKRVRGGVEPQSDRAERQDTLPYLRLLVHGSKHSREEARAAVSIAMQH